MAWMGVGIASISEHTPTPNSQHEGDLLPQGQAGMGEYAGVGCELPLNWIKQQQIFFFVVVVVFL